MGTVLGPEHLEIRRALIPLIEGRGAAGDESGAQDGVQQQEPTIWLQARDSSPKK